MMEQWLKDIGCKLDTIEGLVTDIDGIVYEHGHTCEWLESIKRALYDADVWIESTKVDGHRI